MPAATASSSWPRARPSRTPLTAAFSAATSIATGSMSEAIARAAGHSRSAAKASRPVPVPMSARLAMLRAGRLQPVERDQAAGGGLVLAGAEGAAGVDLEARPRPAGTASRCAGVWTKKRPARIGSSPAWRERHPILVAELLHGRPRAARARREGEQQVDVGRARARPRNRRPSATPRRPPRWSSAPAANRAARTGRCRPSAPRPPPWCRAG